jgi:hypothetical protein
MELAVVVVVEDRREIRIVRWCWRRKELEIRIVRTKTSLTGLS